MKDIESQAARSAFEAWMASAHPGVDLSRRVDGSYWSSTPDSFFDGFLGGWKARAAVEADRAQRVPDVDALADKIAECLHGTYHCTRVWEAWHVGTMSQDDFEPVDESETPREIAEEIVALLASTPAPAQQEPDWKDMYEKEKRRSAMWIAKYEKDIGPLECAGPVSHQEPPHQERKPMTRAQVEEMSAQEEFFLICDDIESLGQIVEAVERHHGIKE